jgi:hypothetical protein
MKNLKNIQEDIASLPPDAQQIIYDLVEVLKKRYFSGVIETSENNLEEWADFIGCMEAETDLSRNYKTYLKRTIQEKYDNH